MNKILSALFALMLVLSGCGDSTSASDSGSKGGNFPSNGDPDFYCDVTEGDNWWQMKVNIPNYMGMVEKFTYEENGTGTQYYEESYFGLSTSEKKMMCMEWNQEIKEKSRKKNFKETYCGNGVFYSIIEYEGQSRESIVEEASYFEEKCQRYKRKWENGEFDEDYDD